MKRLLYYVATAFSLVFFIASYLFVSCVIPGYIIWKVIPIGWLGVVLIAAWSVSAITFGVAWFTNDNIEHHGL